MRTRSVLTALSIVVMSVPAATAAQEREGEAAAEVRAALQHYLDGHATGQGAHHDSVFHEVADLMWIADGELRTRPSAEYIAGAPGRPAANESERRRRVAWVEVTGDAAVARVELDYPGAFFVDYMSLLKIDGEWRIVNKIFHVDRSGGSGSGSGSARPERG